MKPNVDEWVESVHTLGEIMEVSKDGICWSCNVTSIRVAINPENHSRVRIWYGYDLFHHQIILYVVHTMIEYGWHGYMWPDLPENEAHRDMNPWTKFGGTLM